MTTGTLSSVLLPGAPTSASTPAGAPTLMTIPTVDQEPVSTVDADPSIVTDPDAGADGTPDSMGLPSTGDGAVGTPAEMGTSPPSGTVTDPNDSPDDTGSTNPDDTSGGTDDFPIIPLGNDNGSADTGDGDTGAGSGTTGNGTDDGDDVTGDADIIMPDDDGLSLQTMDKKDMGVVLAGASAVLIMLGSFFYFLGKKQGWFSKK